MSDRIKNLKTVVDVNFEIALVQTDSGAYKIAHIRYSDPDEIHTTSPIEDLKTACIVFEQLLMELQGN